MFLRDVDPTIVQDIRYATTNNFTGAPLPGYDAPECVLKMPAAEALKRVQQELARTKLSLKVFDCYRPVRASTAMARWANDGTSGDTSRHFFPRVPKIALFARGFISARSEHSLGTAVDLTIVDPADQRAQSGAPLQAPCTAPAAQRGAEGVDMGTAFDCFDPRSATEFVEITAVQRRWRQRLRSVMDREAFSNYPREWWHYSRQRARGVTYFDFVIPKR